MRGQAAGAPRSGPPRDRLGTVSSSRPLEVVSGALVAALLVTLALAAAWRPRPVAMPAPPRPSPSASPWSSPSPSVAAPTPSPSPSPRPLETPSPSPVPSPRTRLTPGPPAPSPDEVTPEEEAPTPILAPPEAGPVEVPLETPSPEAEDTPVPAVAPPSQGPLEARPQLMAWNPDSADPSVRVRVDLVNRGPEEITVERAEVEFQDDYGQPLISDRQDPGRLAPGEGREVWFFYLNSGRLSRVRVVLRVDYRSGGEAFTLERRLPG